MLVVKVEVWPFGDETQAREIGRMEIANVGGDDDVGEYVAKVKEDKRGHSLLLKHKREEGALALVRAVLNKLAW